jgi:hypothetical protein
MKNLLLSLLILTGLSAASQDLAISKIDHRLMVNANVIIRNSFIDFEVRDMGTATETRHVELTIFNEAGRREAIQVVPYSDLTKVLDFKGEIYSGSGIRVKKLKASDINDVSAGGGDMYTDHRLKVLDFSYPVFPYSIVFEYKVQHDGLMFYPSWYPQNNRKTSVARAVFRVTVPESLGLNYYEHMVAGKSSRADGSFAYEWEVENIQGFEHEPYGPPGRELSPYVLVTPKKFEMEGYTGSMNTWEDIGTYDLALLKGRGDLPEAARAEIEKITQDVTDPREIARLVYEHVQNTTRYVSVQLGIGGWQPFEASYVYENGYGDCKALTNYTAALLKHVGVESIYTSVWAGRGESDIVTEFPNARFNHAFLAVPLAEDTVWLECTSQTAPFGYTGTHTSDRHVLLTTNDGGKLVKTPAYTEKDNIQQRVMKVIISKNGDAAATINTVYSGIQYENVRSQLHASPEERKKWLLTNLGLNKTRVQEFNYDYKPGVVPEVTETIKLTSKGFGSVTGNRIFIEANPLNQFSSIPKKVKERQTEVHIRLGFTDIDSVHFILPDGYHVEHLPAGKIINNNFGEYSASFDLTEDGIFYIRKMILRKGVHPATSYEDFRTMLKDISRADKTKIVLVGST